MSLTIEEPLIDVARRLVRENMAAEPGIVNAYLFPDQDEIRLVYVDSTSIPNTHSDHVTPYYFGRDLAGGITYRSAIAIIVPDEVKKLDTPEGWGPWEDAMEIG